MWWLLGLAAWAGGYADDHNHPRLRWKTIRTEHFSIHFPTSSDRVGIDGTRVAQRLASSVEPLRLQLCHTLQFCPEERTHILLLEHSDTLEGFTLPQPGWIVLSGHPGHELTRDRGTVDWVTDLFAHEYTHILTLKRTGVLAESAATYGVELGGSGVMTLPTEVGVGLQLSVSANEPYWFSEGAAEFWAAEAGLNRWNSARDATLRVAALDEKLLDWQSWQHPRGLDDYFESERAYQQGFAFHRWLAHHYGTTAMRRQLEYAGKRYRPRWTRSFLDAYEQPAESLFRQFVEDTRDHYLEQAHSIRERGLNEGTPLAIWNPEYPPQSLADQDRWVMLDSGTRDSRRARGGTRHLHPQATDEWYAVNRGGWLALSRQASGLWTVFNRGETDPDLTAEQREQRWEQAIWLPISYGADFDFIDAHSLVLEADAQSHRGPLQLQLRHPTQQLFLADLSIGSRTVPHLDGKQAIPSTRESDAATRRRLRPIPGTERGSAPAVSSDGRLAFLQYHDGQNRLMVGPLEGPFEPLLDPTGPIWMSGVDWSPDGDQLVVSAFVDGQNDLFLVSSEGGLEPLTQDRFEEVDPHWGHDGWIYYGADLDGVYNIYRRQPGTDFAEQVTNVLGSAQAPALTPDGDLLFSVFSGYGWRAHGLNREDFGTRRVVDVVTRAAALPQSPDAEVRRYSPTALLAPGVSPIIRLDGPLGELGPTIGAFVRLRDAAERFTWSTAAFAGPGVSAQTRLELHHLLSADIITTARYETSPMGLSQTLGGGVGVEWPLSDRIELGVSGQIDAWPLGADERLHRLPVGLTLGDTERWYRDPNREQAVLQLQATPSDFGGRRYTSADALLRWVGPLSGAHRVVARLRGAGSTWDEAPDNVLVGLRAPNRLWWGQPQPRIDSAILPVPSTSSPWVGQLAAAWRMPLGPELDRFVGPWFVERFWLELGGEGVLLPNQPIAGPVAALRSRMVLMDGTWDSHVRVGWAPGYQPVVSIGLGTGF